MSIQGLSGSAYSHTFTTPEARVALLVLNSEDAQQAAQQQTVELSRERFIEASAAEVAAMRDEAEHLFAGALMRAGVSLAGVGLQVVAVQAEADATLAAAGAKCDLDKARQLASAKAWSSWQAAGSAAAQGLAPAVESALGSLAADARADAAQASKEAELAKWDLEDGEAVLRASAADQQRAVDWLSDRVGSDAQLSATLSNLA
jgi:hypothetical protein